MLNFKFLYWMYDSSLFALGDFLVFGICGGELEHI